MNIKAIAFLSRTALAFFLSLSFLLSCASIYKNIDHDKILEKYRVDIAYALEDNWDAPKLSGEELEGLKTSIIITVLPSGKFDDFIIVNSSGNDEWDKSVIVAIEKTDPFKPFPERISSDQVKVGINFTPNRLN